MDWGTVITPELPFRSQPRISRSEFSFIIRLHAAAAVSAERDPGQYYDAIKSFGIDPLLILAMFQHESQMGREGVATQTRSWGNTRLPNFGAQSVGMADGASGQFPIFATWLNGCISTAARLASTTYVYAARTTIRDIFDWPPDPEIVWAPAGDFNNPASYLRAVIDYMNAQLTELLTTGGSIGKAIGQKAPATLDD